MAGARAITSSAPRTPERSTSATSASGRATALRIAAKGLPGTRGARAAAREAAEKAEQLLGRSPRGRLVRAKRAAGWHRHGSRPRR